MLASRRVSALCLACAWGAACASSAVVGPGEDDGHDAAPPTDARVGRPDTGVDDAGADDAGAEDAGADAGARDAGDEDAEVDADTPRLCGFTLGERCRDPRDCDDGCWCNGAEVCRNARCIEGTPVCGAPFDCVSQECDEATRTCGALVLDDSVCDDGDVCTGAEVCDRRLGCVEGTPLRCDDGDGCTTDRCEDPVGCVFAPRDLDGDGFVDSRCTDGPDADCRDDRADINPDQPEICDNFEDDDCDGRADVFDPDCAP